MTSSTLLFAPVVLALPRLLGCGEKSCGQLCEHLGRCTQPVTTHFSALKTAACGAGLDACEERKSGAAPPYDVNTEVGRGLCVIATVDRLALIQRYADAPTWKHLDVAEFCKAVELVLSGEVSKEHQEPYARPCGDRNSHGFTDSCTWVYDQLTTQCDLSLPPKS